MNFRKQLIGGHAFAMLLVAATAAMAIGALRVTSAREGDVARQLAEKMGVVRELRVLAEEVVATSRGYLLTGEARFRSRFDAARADFEGGLQRLRIVQLDPAGELEGAAVDRAARAYTAAAIEAALERATTNDPSKIVPFFDATLQPRREALESSVAIFADHERVVFESSLRDAQAVATEAQILLGAGALLAITLGVILAIVVSRRLASQFDRMKQAEAAASVAAGAREEVLAVVSHDLRNPLAAITFGAALLDEAALDDRARTHLRTIRNAADRMQHLIEDLLDSARAEHYTVVLRLQPCDAHGLLDEAIELFHARAVDREIELRAEGDRGTVLCDRERVLEVLSNLVGNAFELTPRGGEIVIKADRRTRDMRFVVADTGPGISAEQLPHLFERYWQASPGKARKGLGLGLYICKQFVEAHHGAIGVDSTPGKGTAFWFTLPTVATEADAAAAATR